MHMRCLGRKLRTKSYKTSKLTKTCVLVVMFIFKDSFQCYFNEFCDVAKMAIIHTKKFIKIWLQIKYERKKLQSLFYFFSSNYNKI